MHGEIGLKERELRYKRGSVRQDENDQEGRDGVIEKEAKMPARKRGPKKFKLHRMTKKQLEEERIPAYDYIL